MQDRFRNFERAEQSLIGKIQDCSPGRLFQHPRKNLYPKRRILKFSLKSGSPAQKIQCRLRPVITRTNLGPWLRLVLIGSCHGKKMAKRNIIDCLFSSLHSVIREELQHFLFCAPDMSPVYGNAYEKRNNTLGYRHHIQGISPAETVPVILVTDVSVLYYGNFTYIRLRRCHQLM